MSNNVLTTYEQREVIRAHNDIFLHLFMNKKLSSAFSLYSRSGSDWVPGYILQHKAKEVEGI